MLTYSQKEHNYRRRILVITPIACVLVALLFLSSDVVPVKPLDPKLGWEGPVQLLPEITIIPDKEVQEENREESILQTMASMDIELIEDIADAEGGQNELVKEAERVEEDTPELDLTDVRHIPKHTDVPFTDNYVILHMVQPEYPPREMLAGIEGDVMVEILVNEQGLVENAWILLADGPQSFEDASLNAVKQFRFKPPTENGKPIPMWIRFQVRFRLLS